MECVTVKKTLETFSMNAQNMKTDPKKQEEELWS